MARTNLQLITDSLRLVGVVGEIDTPSNEDAQDALRRMNDMMSRFDRVNGIRLGYYPQTSLSANIPVDDEYFEPITLLLSKPLAAHWGFSLPQATLMEINQAWSGLLAEFTAPEPADMDHLPAHGRSSYNINSDV